MKIGAGTGGDAELERRARAQAHLVENAPLASILLRPVEQQGAADRTVKGEPYGAEA